MEIVIIDQTNNEELLKLDSYFERIADRTSRLLERAKDASLSVIFVTPEKIHEINAAYRKIDRPTDVISFAMQDDPSNIYVSEEENELGDIFINVQAIEDQAKEYGHSPLREACFLFTHGLLHLLGYDHMEPDDEKIMFSLQDEILDEVVQR